MGGSGFTKEFDEAFDKAMKEEAAKFNYTIDPNMSVKDAFKNKQ